MLHRLLAALKSVPKELPQPSARCLYALATTAPAPNSTGSHKFIGFHTHIWANLQYLRYWWLQRELTLLFISAAIQLLLTSIVLARFELFSFVSTAAYPFTIFLLRFNLLSLCAMYSFLLLLLFVSLSVAVLCIHSDETWFILLHLLHFSSGYAVFFVSIHNIL